MGTLGAKHPIHLTFFLTKDLLEASYYYHPAAGDIPLVGARDRAGTITLQEYDVQDPSILVASFVLTPSPDGSLRGSWQPWAARSGATHPLAVVLRPKPGPTLATCPPARLRQRPHQLLPTILTGDKLRDARLQTQLEAAAALLAEGDTQTCTVSYFGHGLLSLSLVSEIVGANVSGYNRVCVVDVCAAAPIDMAQELEPRRRAAFEREANRWLQQLLEVYIREQGDEADEAINAELRAQAFELIPNQLALTTGHALFPTQVSTQSSLVNKSFAGGFGPSFTFAELQTYLRPQSPLRRLAPVSDVKKAVAASKR